MSTIGVWSTRSMPEMRREPSITLSTLARLRPRGLGLWGAHVASTPFFLFLFLGGLTLVFAEWPKSKWKMKNSQTIIPSSNPYENVGLEKTSLPRAKEANPGCHGVPNFSLKIDSTIPTWGNFHSPALSSTFSLPTSLMSKYQFSAHTHSTYSGLLRLRWTAMLSSKSSNFRSCPILWTWVVL